ncbi:MAG: hypothetical protein M3443_08795 [Actinomycetota bacterium]|nr:hypothetical protein [Actinomycetota bacterium]
MSVEKVVAELQRVLGLLDLPILMRAAELIDQAEHGIAQATQGSQQPDAGQVVAQFASVKQQLEQAHHQIEQTRQLVQRYVANIAGSSLTTVTTSTPKPTSTSPAQGGSKKINDILAGLPPEVPKPNPSGKKTHGQVVGSEDVVISGEDAESDEVWQRLVTAGVPEKFKPMSIDHVEMKVALRMVKSGNTSVELAINNKPCRGLWSCRALLPILLPEGYTLTVYGPNYRGTFTGGKKWSS